MALKGENVTAMGSKEEILRANSVKGVKIKAEENKSGGLKRNKER